MVSSTSTIAAVLRRIEKYIHRTPVMSSRQINGLSDSNVFFKCENFQRMGAFKMRGAMNAILSLSQEQLSKGVATHSSGNFAQALSLAAKEMNVKAYIVMPNNAPAIKTAAVKGYGGRVIECEPTLQAREQTLNEVVEKTGATFLHPYNQKEVIMGQGTAALELMQEVPDLDYIITPVGGGGLISGTALAVQEFSAKTIVIGGEPFGADDAWRSVEAGHIIPSENPQTIADGLRTSLGDQTFPIIKKHVEEIIRVEEDEIIAAMRFIWERMKIIIEPSSAVALAALLKDKQRFEGKRTGVIISGGNVDLSGFDLFE
ncbi:MAG: pyridoxal-phosphate dependent enzyme [Bacteroidales bacterium]|nr:pyridoxal-phosphate dependent enzyme [Bacteroidales bacterium]